MSLVVCSEVGGHVFACSIIPVLFCALKMPAPGFCEISLPLYQCTVCYILEECNLVTAVRIFILYRSRVFEARVLRREFGPKVGK
jgi:hypothetical protein